VKRFFISVEVVTAEHCRLSDRINVTSSPSGYIASIVTSETYGCNDGRHAWAIEGEPGQQINLTLLDFTSFADMNAYKLLDTMVCIKHSDDGLYKTFCQINDITCFAIRPVNIGHYSINFFYMI